MGDSDRDRDYDRNRDQDRDRNRNRTRDPIRSENAGDTGTDDGNDTGTTTRSEATDASGSGPREVVVPLRLYKTITVFSTLIAIVGIVGGFILLDVATNRAQADLSEINVALAVLGIGLIVTGAVTYAFSTRFRTAEMGNAKDDTDEHSGTNNGR